MYDNQSFEEMPEDMFLHGKLINDGGIICSKEIPRGCSVKNTEESTLTKKSKWTIRSLKTQKRR